MTMIDQKYGAITGGGSSETPNFEERIPEEKDPHQKFLDGLAIIKKQINDRFRALYRALDAEIVRCTDDADAVSLARTYTHFRNAWAEDEDSIKEEMASVDRRYRKLMEHDYPETLQMQGLASVPLADVGRSIGISVSTKASVKSGCKELAIEYLRADQTAIEALSNEDYDTAIAALKLGGRKKLAKRLADDATQQCDPQEIINEIRETTDNLEGIVVDHIFPQTLSSIAKDMVNEGKELPEDYFNTYLHTTTTWRKLPSKS